MRKLNLFIAVLLSVFLFSSCEKNPDELTITINQTGTLSVKVVDEDKKGVSNAEVAVNYYGDKISEGLTDNDGYHTEKLIQGFYTCYVSAVLGKATYTDSKRVQIIAGENKQIELDPSANSGKGFLKIFKGGDYPDYEQIPVKNINVALVRSEDYNNLNSIDEYIAAAHFIEKTDAQGMVNILNIPANVNYRVILYNENGEMGYYGWYSVYVQRGGVFSETIQVYY